MPYVFEDEPTQLPQPRYVMEKEPSGGVLGRIKSALPPLPNVEKNLATFARTLQGGPTDTRTYQDRASAYREAVKSGRYVGDPEKALFPDEKVDVLGSAAKAIRSGVEDVGRSVLSAYQSLDPMREPTTTKPGGSLLHAVEPVLGIIGVTPPALGGTMVGETVRSGLESAGASPNTQAALATLANVAVPGKFIPDAVRGVRRPISPARQAAIDVAKERVRGAQAEPVVAAALKEQLRPSKLADESGFTTGGAGRYVFEPEVPSAAKEPPTVQAPVSEVVSPVVEARAPEAKAVLTPEEITVKANDAATSPLNDLPQPTQGQIEAGNYKKAHLAWNGMDITIENPKGSTRSGVGPDGQPWSVDMPAHYGYLKRTKGADGDHVDIYLGETPSNKVFIVDQIDADTGKFDEHKVIGNVGSLEEATKLYDAGFSDGRGPARSGAVTEMNVGELKDWLDNGQTKKPIAYQEKISSLTKGDNLTAKPVGELSLDELFAIAEGKSAEQPTVTAAPKRPASQAPEQGLAGFLKTSGGISIGKSPKEAGELRARRQSPKGKTFIRVGTKDGLTLDEAALKAHEAGFIEEPSARALLDAIDSEVSGKPVKSVQSDTFGDVSKAEMARMDMQAKDVAVKDHVENITTTPADLEYNGKVYTGAVKEGDGVRLKDHPDKVLKAPEQILKVEEKIPFDVPNEVIADPIGRLIQLEKDSYDLWGNSLESGGRNAGGKRFLEALELNKQEIAALETEMTPKSVGVVEFFNTKDNRGAVIHPSAKTSNAYQVSFFDNRGFMSDIQTKDIGEALREAKAFGGERSTGNLERLMASPEFANGNELTRVVGMANELRLIGDGDGARLVEDAYQANGWDYAKAAFDERTAQKRQAPPSFQQTPAGQQAMIPGSEGRSIPQTGLRSKAKQSDAPLELEQPGIQAKEPELFGNVARGASTGADTAIPTKANAEALRLRRRADTLSRDALKMVEGIPPGQPIMSTRDLNLRQRATARMRESVELIKRAEQIEGDGRAGAQIPDVSPVAVPDSQLSPEEIAARDEMRGMLTVDKSAQAKPVVDPAIQARVDALEAENADMRAKQGKAQISQPIAKPATLRRLADAMDAQIESKRNPPIANQNPTRRRANIADSMRAEGDRMVETQKGLRAVADAIETGTLPDSLRMVASRTDIEEIRKSTFYAPSVRDNDLADLVKGTKGMRGAVEVHKAISRIRQAKRGESNAVPIHGAKDLETIGQLVDLAEKSPDQYVRRQITNVRDEITQARRKLKLGLDTQEKFTQAKADLENISGPKSKVDDAARLIREAESKLIGMKEPGVFFTPKDLADRVAAAADIQPGMRVLEPSAGKGDLADAIKRAQPEADISAMEFRSNLNDILELKGHKVVGRDFLEETAEPIYDRIVMNPPFENSQDIEHIQRAYEFLKPGGKLVAIMSEGPYFRNDAKAAAFRAWMDSVGAKSEKLPDKSFTGPGTLTQTGVSTRLLTVDKPPDLSGASVIDLLKKGFGSETGTVGKLTPEQSAIEASARAARQEIYRRLNNEAAKTGESIEAVAERLKLPSGMLAKIQSEAPPPAPPTPHIEPPDGGFVTSIKNAQVDKELLEIGRPPATHGERLTFEQSRAEAAQAMQADPFAGQKLVNQLIGNPRPATAFEDALLLHEQTRLINERIAAEGALIDAQKSGNPELISAAKTRVEAATADFMTLGDVVTQVGTESSLSLGHRRMMMKEDFSLASMERAKQVANDGAPLTDAQRAEVKAWHEKAAATQKAFDEYVAKAETRRAEMESEIAHSRMVNEASDIDPHIKSMAERIIVFMEGQADNARERLKSKLSSLHSGVDPTIISDLAIIGAAKIARRGLDFTRWSKSMLDDFGDKIGPYLQDVWAASNKQLDARIEAMSGKSSEPVKRVVKTGTVTERLIMVKENLQAAIESNPGADITRQAQTLAKLFVEQGVKGRDALINAVHKELQDVVPDITKRQAMDAISGYGKFTQLSKDQISAELRDLKGQMQQVAKLEDIQSRQPPLKTGLERRVISDEERHLIQQVNEAKRRYGVVITDPETQLKSALDARKTYYHNAISDLEAQIRHKEKFVKEKTASPTDAELLSLKSRHQDLKKEFDEVFGKPEMTDEQRIAAAIRGTERSIATLEQRIADNDVGPRPKAPVLTSPALDAARARRDALQSQLQELRDVAYPGKTPEEIALQTLKTRLKHQTADMLDRLDRGDFTKKPAREVKFDKEAHSLQYERDRVRAQWNQALLKDRLAHRSVPKKIIGTVGEVLNTSRAVLTGLDLSAPLRQGGFISFAHPIRSAKAMPDMFRAFLSENGQHRATQEILSRENYPLYKRAKLYLSEEGTSLSHMEEAYMSRWSSHIPLVAGSQRAYTTFLNKLRADSFDAMEQSLSRHGKATPEEANAIANFINVATGRGNIGMNENAMVGLNTAFFAPRYVASRFQLIAGQPFYRGSLRTRTAIAGEYARMLTGLGMVYGLANMSGAEVEYDPRSSDFGKIKIGNTRVDPLAGLSQATVLLSREILGETKNLKGRVSALRGDKKPIFGQSAAGVLGSFLRSKLSPAFGAGVNILAGENVVGEPTTPESVALNLAVPLAMQDIYDAMKEQGVPSGTALGLLGIFGMSLQTFDANKKRVKDRSTFAQRWGFDQ